jgi:hypothetical protein
MSPQSKTRSPSTPSGLPLPDRIRTFDISYKLIPPDEFGPLGIDPKDVPVGTFVAEDHPPFLASRFGGNAYGLGIVEHRDKLEPSELEFLEKLDLSDPKILRQNYGGINSIYRKLGLLMRFSRHGKRYFLIPINWVSHSLEHIKDKVDEIERVLLKQTSRLKKERLNVCLLTAANDLIVHEITGRMPTQRFVIIDSVAKLREASGPFDLVVVPKDLDDLLLSLGIESLIGSTLTQESFTIHGTYIAGKLYDLLRSEGELLVIAIKPFPRTNKEIWVEFRDPEDLRNFLLFTHVFRSKKRYRGKGGTLLRVHLTDFYNYLSGIFVPREELRKVLGDRDPKKLALEDIDHLPRLDLKITGPRRAKLESRWDKVLSPYFESIASLSKLAPSVKEDWERNYIVEGDLPDNLQIYVGQKREPPVRLEQMEKEERASGMAGCSLALVAAYKNSFEYLFAVLDVLTEIKDKHFERLTELELNRLYNPFAAPKNRYRAFKHIKQLMNQTSRLHRLEILLNPDHIEGASTKVLENIEKLALLGVSPPLLREIYLIVVGHTTMGRVTFGKLPDKTLKSITDQAKRLSLEEMADLLRIIRLVSMAEIAASLGDKLTQGQGKELFSLYDQAIWIAADPQLDWETLHDQQIAALGGAQNLALRQMLKMFNLFEYLDSWTELADKGPFQKEALADYHPAKFFQIDQVLELIRITNQFKERFYEREAFSRPYFFRKLLNCQFHGTGHLLPLLGTRAGFILLWITIGASPGNAINFDPLVSYEQEASDDRPARVKAALDSLDIEQLDFTYLASIKRALSQGRPAFIYNSGIQLRYNSVSQATEVVFIDVEDNLKRMEVILQSAHDRLIPDMPVPQLREADRLFRELHSYHEHLKRHSAAKFIDSELLAEQTAEIGRSCSRLEDLFAQKLFVPQRLSDTLEILYEHCPNIGRRIMTEFWELDRIKPTQKIYAGETIPNYILRCLKKFQALVTGEREALQDTEIFYQLAQQQFGSMAGETVGISNAQIDILEEVVHRLGSRPALLEALSAALIFQEIGKLPLYLEDYRSVSKDYTHARAGAKILRRQALLKRLGMERGSSKVAGFLVEVHGLVGHVLRGEVALPALEVVTNYGDDLVFEAFFLHSVLAAAAYREGLMVEDLLDRFLELRQVALLVIQGEVSWQTHMQREFLLIGQGLLTETTEARAGRGPLALFSEWDNGGGDDALRRKGEDVAAVERLFRLLGLADVNCVDIQMRILDMPVNFIYHKKGLKSTGSQKFEADLLEAETVCEAIMALDQEIRRNLIDKLSPETDRVRIYGLEYVAYHLEPADWLKLLVLAFKALDRFCTTDGKPQVVDLLPLCQIIDRRYQALATDLVSIPMDRLFKDGRLLSRLAKASVGLVLRYSRKDNVVTLLYQDRLQVQRILDRVRSQEDISALKHLYHRELKRLKNHEHPTEDYQKLLSETFHERLQGLIELTLKKAQRKMRQHKSYAGMEKVFAELMALAEENAFSDEQIQLAKDMYEYNRDRLRNLRLEVIYQDIDSCTSKEKLKDLWEKIRAELVGNRRHLGQEFEDLVTKRFDERLRQLTAS